MKWKRSCLAAYRNKHCQLNMHQWTNSVACRGVRSDRILYNFFAYIEASVDLSRPDDGPVDSRIECRANRRGFNVPIEDKIWTSAHSGYIGCKLDAGKRRQGENCPPHPHLPRAQGQWNVKALSLHGQRVPSTLPTLLPYLLYPARNRWSMKSSFLTCPKNIV